MNRNLKNKSKAIWILLESLPVILSEGVGVFVWVIVEYYCVHVWVAYSVCEGTNAERCFNRI